MDHTFKITQGGIVVAEITSDDRMKALREAMHYALHYGQDGSVSVEGVTKEDFDALSAPDGWDKAVAQ